MKRILTIHSCWAAAVLGAFVIGSRNGEPAESAGSKDGGPVGNKRASSRFSEMESAMRPGRSGNRPATNRSDSELSRLFGNIVSTAGGLDALAAQALKDPNPITRRLAFAKLLEALTPENAKEIRTQLVTLGADSGQWNDFHYSWGALDGKAAFDHAAASSERDLAITMTGWAAANPGEALALLDKLPPEMQGQRDELTASVVSGLAHHDRSMATDLVLRLSSQGNERAGNLMEIVANETLRTAGHEAASQWSEALPDGPLKGTAMSRIADVYARKDPAGAALWAQKFASENYAARTIERVGGTWAQSDPVAAVGWLEGLPAGNGQMAGLRNAFGDWEDRDPAAAGEYLVAMPQSPKRDSAISGFAMGYAWQNPKLAITWAQDIQDPALRQTSLTRAGQAYFRRDPDAARVWLDSSGLPEETRKQIADSNNRR
jgi:hypothetical protein